MRRSFIIIVLSLSALVTSCTGPGGSSSTALIGTVAVGSATDQPGLGFLQPGVNRTDGFDADAIRWIAANSSPQWTPAFTPVAVADRLGALERRSVQLVAQSFSITDDRLNQIDMAGPYLQNYEGIMVRAGDASMPTPDSIRGRSVCTLRGSTGEIELQKRGALVTADSGASQCVDRLLKGQVDAFSTDQLILYGYSRSVAGLYVVPQNTFGLREEYGIGIPYGSFDECVKLSEAIQRFIDSPEWDQYLQNNFGSFDRSAYRPTSVNPCKKR